MRMNVTPGDRRDRSSMFLRPCESSFSWLNALTLIGTSCRRSSRRVAVTTTSSMPPAAAPLSAVCATAVPADSAPSRAAVALRRTRIPVILRSPCSCLEFRRPVAPRDAVSSAPPPRWRRATSAPSLVLLCGSARSATAADERYPRIGAAAQRRAARQRRSPLASPGRPGAKIPPRRGPAPWGGGPEPDRWRSKSMVERARNWIGGVAIGLAAGWAGIAGAAVPAADFVVTDARIYTAAGGPLASALAVRAGRLVYVGAADGLKPYIGPRTRIERAGGRLVIPGLADTHIHPLDIVDLDVCDLDSRPMALRELSAFVRACLARYRLAPGKRLVVHQWNYTAGNQPDAEYPTLRRALDRASTRHQIELLGNDAPPRGLQQPRARERPERPGRRRRHLEGDARRGLRGLREARRRRRGRRAERRGQRGRALHDQPEQHALHRARGDAQGPRADHRAAQQRRHHRDDGRDGDPGRPAGLRQAARGPPPHGAHDARAVLRPGAVPARRRRDRLGRDAREGEGGAREVRRQPADRRGHGQALRRRGARGQPVRGAADAAERRGPETPSCSRSSRPTPGGTRRSSVTSIPIPSPASARAQIPSATRPTPRSRPSRRPTASTPASARSRAASCNTSAA